MTIFVQWTQALINGLAGLGMPMIAARLLVQSGMLLLGFALAFAAYRVVEAVVVQNAIRFSERTKAKWDDALVQTRILHWLAHLAPLVVLNTFNHLAFVERSLLKELLQTIIHLYLISLIAGTLSSLLDFLSDRAMRTGKAQTFPAKGVAQALKLILLLVAFILGLSVLLGKSPAYLLSGLGALTAILMLIFKDAILGFTAGIMLSANRLVSLGDWIEMPSAGADGSVVDISLTTVQVQNFDKTIISIPAYDLVSKAFKNWRGMVRSGGRRIKRSIHIDMQSIRFADEPMLERWRKIELLRPYLLRKLEEINRSNENLDADLSVLGNGRRLTNIGVFRAYCLAYLKASNGIHENMLCMVRQLNPTELGIPLEIYAFTNKTDWIYYEGVQSDIFDHLLAIIGEFGLSVYQRESDAASRNAHVAVE